MKYDPTKHHRKSIRLRGYDYTKPGYYFVTICTENRGHFFGEISDGQMQLNTIGQIVSECWEQIPQHFKNVMPDTFMIMPNHVHGIVRIVSEESLGPVGTWHAMSPQAPQAPQTILQKIFFQPIKNQNVFGVFGKPIPGALSTIIRSFKSAATKKINELWGTRGLCIWQRDYYEHIIRYEGSLNRIRVYIANNPKNWNST